LLKLLVKLVLLTHSAKISPHSKSVVTLPCEKLFLYNLWTAADDDTDIQQTLPAATDNSDQPTVVNNTPSRLHHITSTQKPPNPDDETITLVQFLAECNRSPRSRVGERWTIFSHFLRAKAATVCLSVCLSVCPFVCHTGGLVKNGAKLG